MSETKGSFMGFLNNGLTFIKFLLTMVVFSAFHVGFYYSQFNVLADTLKKHVANDSTHLTAKQIYWLEKIDREGFSWNSREKAEFLQEFQQLKSRMEMAFAEGRFQTPAEKRRLIEEVLLYMKQKGDL
jgi:hypothetical protein